MSIPSLTKLPCQRSRALARCARCMPFIDSLSKCVWPRRTTGRVEASRSGAEEPVPGFHPSTRLPLPVKLRRLSSSLSESNWCIRPNALETSGKCRLMHCFGSGVIVSDWNFQWWCHVRPSDVCVCLRLWLQGRNLHARIKWPCREQIVLLWVLPCALAISKFCKCAMIKHCRLCSCVCTAFISFSSPAYFCRTFIRERRVCDLGTNLGCSRLLLGALRSLLCSCNAEDLSRYNPWKWHGFHRYH